MEVELLILELLIINSNLFWNLFLTFFIDHLLCHDDKCEDRCIAFVYYLTEAHDCGGSFDMFDHDGNMVSFQLNFNVYKCNH